MAAEGGIMRKPVDALVSKGELIYNPVTKKLSQVPGSKGKPNKADDVYAKLYEGDVVISNSPTMLMSNGKTPAQNLMGMVDKYATGGTVKAREAIIKKVVNWQEANKTKPQEYVKFDKGGEVVKLGKDPIEKLEEELYKPQTPEITGKDRRWIYHASKALNTLSDSIPLAAALLGDYNYHTESPQVTPPMFVPVNADPRPLLRAADESSSIGNYNLANMGVGTGAYMTHSAQLASNRAKRYSDAYKWQQETNNKLIAQNAGIYNDWRKQYDVARYKAIENTMANEAAAQQMRDQAIKDAYEFQTGRRNDRWKLSMMEPLMKYAVDENIYKKFKV